MRRTSFEVRPPTVREALVVLSAGPAATKGDTDSAKIVVSILKDWFPRKLFKRIMKESPETAIQTALQIANEGLHVDGKKAKEPEEIDWLKLITSLMDVFPYRIDEVYDMEWPSFVLLTKHLSRVKAIRKLDHIHALSVVNIRDNGERQAAFARIKALAGFDPIEKISDEQALANLNALQMQMVAMTGQGTA